MCESIPGTPGCTGVRSLSIVLLVVSGTAQRERAQKVNFPLSVGSLKKTTYSDCTLHGVLALIAISVIGPCSVIEDCTPTASVLLRLAFPVISRYPTALSHGRRSELCQTACIARDGAGSDGGCQGRFRKLVVFGPEGLGDKCSTHLWNPSWLSRKDVCTCRMSWGAGSSNAAVRERRSDIAQPDISQHRSGAGEPSRVEQGRAARIEGGRRVCARSDCDSDSGEVQCASMYARLYRGVQASVLRGD